MMSELQRLLLFSAGGERFAIRLREIAEVVEPIPLNSIPRVPPFMVGVINFHGTVVPVVDLALLRGAVPRQGEGKFVVLDQRHVQLALLVDPVVDVVGEHMVIADEPSEQLELGERMLHFADGESRLLDIERLVMKIEEIING